VNDDTLDPIIHTQARLRIMVTLNTLPEGDQLTFTRLRDVLGLTGGNFLTHLRTLQDAGYIEVHQEGTGRGSRTTINLTHRGRSALTNYRAALHTLLNGDSAQGSESQIHAP
jgi:DNA-binding MarR family transcriptional regulator